MGGFLPLGGSYLHATICVSCDNETLRIPVLHFKEAAAGEPSSRSQGGLFFGQGLPVDGPEVQGHSSARSHLTLQNHPKGSSSLSVAQVRSDNQHRPMEESGVGHTGTAQAGDTEERLSQKQKLKMN